MKRCKFGRSHFWVRRPDIDVDDCVVCGAVSDERPAEEQPPICYLGHTDCYDLHTAERLADEADWEAEREDEGFAPRWLTSEEIDRQAMRKP